MSTLPQQRTSHTWLFIGDILAFLTISVAGFAMHGEAIDWHIYSTFLPFLLSWAVIAPWLGVYRPEVADNLRQVWKPALAAFLAAPMAAWLRGFLLNNRPILPVFVLVLGGSAAMVFFIWRLGWVILVRRTAAHG